MQKLCILAAIVAVVASNPVQNETFRLYDGQAQFAAGVLETLIKDNPYSNIFLASHNIYRALIHAYMGSTGTTERELKTLLGLKWANNKADVIEEYKKERKAQRVRISKRRNNAIQFNSADKLYFSESAQLKTFIKRMYKDEIQTVDFSEPAAVRNEINAFIKNETTIKNFLPANAVDANTNAILSSSVFFKALFENTFDKHETKNVAWRGGSKKVPMMKIKSEFKHTVFTIKTEGLKQEKSMKMAFLEIPFEGNSANKSDAAISMMIYLPKENMDDQIFEQLLPFTIRTSLKIPDLEYKKITVQVPKIKIQNEFHLKDVLTSMGVNYLFEKGTMGDFGGDVKLDNIIYKAAIKLDEDGTTIATSATDTAYGPEQKPRLSKKRDAMVLNVNRPFVFTINDKIFNEILFAGVYRGPE